MSQRKGPGTARSRIPDSWVPRSDQQLYALAFLGATQVYKLTDFLAFSLRSLETNDSTGAAATTSLFEYLHNRVRGDERNGGPLGTSYFTKWILLDFMAIAIINRLRVPGLLQGRFKAFLYTALLLVANGILFGQLNVGNIVFISLAWFWNNLTGRAGRVRTLSERSLDPSEVIAEQQHLLGHRSVRILTNGEVVHIPILVNHTLPDTIQYAVKAFAHQENALHFETIKANKLERPKRHKIQKALKRRKWYQDEEDALGETSSRTAEAESPNKLGGTQKDGRPSIRAGDTVSALPQEMEASESIYYLPISEVGLVDLVRVQDRDKYDFRIRPNRPVIVAECPSQGHFVLSGDAKVPQSQIRCLGDIDLESVTLRGTGPLSLRYTVSKHGTGAPKEHLIRDIEQNQTDNLLEDTSSALLAANAPNANVGKAMQRLNAADNTGAAQSHVVEIPLHHVEPGLFTVEVKSVCDHLGNVHYPASQMTSRTYQVQTLPSARFNHRRSQGFTGDHVPMKENSTATLHLDINKDRSVKEASIQIRYEPDPASADGMSSVETLSTSQQSYDYAVSRPGTYTILEVLAGTCRGSATDSTISVKEVPPPLSRIEIVPEHDCAGEIGFKANVQFIRGTPPYAFHYRFYRKGHTPSTFVKSAIYKTTEEIAIKPDQPGTYVFEPFGIADKNYDTVPIPESKFEQTIHPQAEFHLDHSQGHHGNRRIIRTCQTNSTDVGFHLKGTAPFTVEYDIVWSNRSDGSRSNATFQSAGRHKLTVELPDTLAKNGGQFFVSLTRVWDGHGCTIALPDHRFAFDVKNDLPTAQFAARTLGPVFHISDGAVASVPLKLTGQSPWHVTYRHDEDGSIHEQRLSQQESQLRLSEPGFYELLQVRDKLCAGSIIASNSRISVNHIQRPSIYLADTDGTRSKTMVHRRPDICKGKSDAVELVFQGTKPFQYRYEHIRLDGREKSSRSLQDRQTANDRTLLPLTTIPGKHEYRMLQVGDAVYGLQPSSDSKQPLFSIEQTVFDRPTALLTNKKGPITYCLNETLRKDHAQVEFIGRAPFTIRIGASNTKKAGKQVFEIDNISQSKWDLQLPTFTFDSTGTYVFNIIQVSDATGCAWEPVVDQENSIRVEVVEPATIRAVHTKSDYCVGDTLEYFLQGMPSHEQPMTPELMSVSKGTRPWAISYTFGGKAHRIETDKPEFHRLADKPGKFDIKSVSHRKATNCEAPVTGLSTTIHPLPSAHIEEGDSWLHEGDLIDIAVHFKGTPPFTFTYTRSTWSGKKLIVEETETIAEIAEHSYVIRSSQQGEYDVISIADRFCRVGATEAQIKRKAIKA